MLRPLPVLVLLLAIGAASAACRGGSAPPAADPAPPVEVEIVRAAMRETADTIELGGALHGRTTATVASRILAPVRAVLVAPGDRVRAGQPLILLDAADLDAAARQADARHAEARQALAGAEAERTALEAAAALARASHRRIAALYERRSATPQELDETRAALDAAEARLTRAAAGLEQARSALEAAGAATDQARAAAAFTRLTAPFDGLVTEKLVDPGNMAAPGAPLLRLEDVGGLEFDVLVDASLADRVAVRRTIPVRVDSGSGPRDVDGRVVRVARAIAVDTHTVLATIAVPANDLAPGMYGRARLAGTVEPRLMVPDGAIVRHGQLASVFVLEQGRARLRLIGAGPSDAGWTRVLAGVVDGDMVIAAPPAALTDGAAAVAAGAPGGTF